MHEFGAPEGGTQPGRVLTSRQVVFLGAASVLGLLLLAFIVQNRDDVHVQFLVFQRTAPLFAVIIVSALLGALLSAGLARARRHRHAR